MWQWGFLPALVFPIVCIWIWIYGEIRIAPIARGPPAREWLLLRSVISEEISLQSVSAATTHTGSVVPTASTEPVESVLPARGEHHRRMSAVSPFSLAAAGLSCNPLQAAPNATQATQALACKTPDQHRGIERASERPTLELPRPLNSPVSCTEILQHSHGSWRVTLVVHRSVHKSHKSSPAQDLCAFGPLRAIEALWLAAS